MAGLGEVRLGMAKNESTPTPEQAKAELERRANNKALRRQGEPPIRENDRELVNASTKQLKEWSETPTSKERR